MKKVLLAAAIAALGTSVWAANPRGNASLTLGGKQVTIDYGRPALKGRPMDELLAQLHADRIWRTGSEQVTTLTTAGAVTIGGQRVPPGKYTLYLHAPTTGAYSLAINKDLGIALIKIYDKAPDNLKNEPWPQPSYESIASQEVARVALRASAPATPSDVFTIDLTPAQDGGVLTLTWGDKSWSADVKAAK